MHHSLKLLGFPVSPHVRAARITLQEKALPYEFQEIDFGFLATAEYGSINPFRKMPALVLNGGSLYEAPAIMSYADAIGSGPSLQPADALDRARMWQFIGVAQSYFYPVGVMKLYFHSVLATLFGVPADPSIAEEAAVQTSAHLDVIEAALQDNCLVARQFTLADIYCGAMVDYVQRTVGGRAALADRPRVQQWLEGLRARDSFASTFAPMLVGTDET